MDETRIVSSSFLTLAFFPVRVQSVFHLWLQSLILYLCQLPELFGNDLKITAGSAILPAPTSPQLRCPVSGSMISMPSARSWAMFRCTGRFRPHLHVHGGGDDDRPGEGQEHRAHNFVGQSQGGFGHDIGRRRSDTEHFGQAGILICGCDPRP